MKTPKKLSDVLKNDMGKDSPYAAVFIPGGHGVMAGIPHSEEVKKVLQWAMDHDKYVITLCHGPASLLAAAVDEKYFTHFIGYGQINAGCFGWAETRNFFQFFAD